MAVTAYFSPLVGIISNNNYNMEKDSHIRP